MARERKRAKQRRERQVRSATPLSHGSSLPENGGDPEQHAGLEEHGGPEHTSGEVDIADAQLALGRPDLVDATPTDVAPGDEISGGSSTDELFEHAFDEGSGDGPSDAGGGGDDDGGGTVARRGGRAPEPSRREGSRFVNFLRGSWRELQRVQWPDRRQVVQATTVVIGFVLIAGGFLGLMDWVAGKIVNFII